MIAISEAINTNPLLLLCVIAWVVMVPGAFFGAALLFDCIEERRYPDIYKWHGDKPTWRLKAEIAGLIAAVVIAFAALFITCAAVCADFVAFLIGGTCPAIFAAVIGILASVLVFGLAWMNTARS